jgi:hypothetical protein
MSDLLVLSVAFGIILAFAFLLFCLMAMHREYARRNGRSAKRLRSSIITRY